jgi:UDP-N-acetylglucosamine 2-epimerase (non-hydrolysing)
VIVFVYGTTAEAIKLAPVARRLAARGVPFEQWLTLQQSDTVLDALPALGLPAPDHLIGRGRGGRALQGPADVVVWLLRIAAWTLRHGLRHRRRLAGGVLVVHGDTMTSVVGALLARVLGVDCAHVEAGLRSGDWRHPFPEELDRRIVGRLATVHYAPSDAAVAALAGRRDVVHTHGNTVTDAVLDTVREPVAAGERAVAGRGPLPLPPGEPYGVVLLHRFEFLSSTRLVDATLAALVEQAPHPFVLVVDDHALHALAGRLAALPEDRVTVVDKMPHHAFTPLLAGAAFVVTDSGGVQEEAALLGVPTLVHRRATERPDGLGANIVLSRWADAQLRRFLDDPASYRREQVELDVSPSTLIAEDLMARGY